MRNHQQNPQQPQQPQPHQPQQDALNDDGEFVIQVASDDEDDELEELAPQVDNPGQNANWHNNVMHGGGLPANQRQDDDTDVQGVPQPPQMPQNHQWADDEWGLEGESSERGNGSENSNPEIDYPSEESSHGSGDDDVDEYYWEVGAEHVYQPLIEENSAEVGVVQWNYPQNAHETNDLVEAATAGNDAVVMRLLAEGADASENNYKAIRRALKNIHVETAKLLVGDDDDAQKFAISYCCSQGYNNRTDIMFDYWRGYQAEDELYDRFCQLAKEDVLGSRYNFTNVVYFYTMAGLDISRVPDLCKELYPANDQMQAELFGQFIENEFIINNSAHHAMLKTFAVNMKDDDAVLDVLEVAQRKMGLDQIDVLTIAHDRLSSKYDSIGDLLKGHTIGESMTPDGVEAVKGLFVGADENMNLAAVFSYYDILGLVGDFMRVITDDLKLQIRTNFHPTLKKAFVSADEHKNLGILAGVDLPKVKVLCDYLKGKLPEIPALTNDKIDTSAINFEGSAFRALNGGKDGFQRGEEEAADTQFRKMLKDKYKEGGAEEVARFFEKVLCLEHTIKGKNNRNEKKVDLLHSCFYSNRAEIAYLLGMEGGLDIFTGCIAALGDGCVANIGTQVRNAIYATLIKDPKDQALYSCFVKSICTPIFNDGGDHLGGMAQGTNVFGNNSITSLYLSPNGFVEKMKREFRYKGSEAADPWEVLRGEDALGAVKAGICSELLGYGDDLSDKASELAAYFCLKSAMPAHEVVVEDELDGVGMKRVQGFVESKYIKEYSNRCEDLREKVDKQYEIDQQFLAVATAIHNFALEGAKVKGKEVAVQPADIAGALMGYFDDEFGESDVERMKRELKIRDDMVDPESHVMRANHRLREAARKIVDKEVGSGNIYPVLKEHFNNYESEKLKKKSFVRNLTDSGVEENSAAQKRGRASAGEEIEEMEEFSDGDERVPVNFGKRGERPRNIERDNPHDRDLKRGHMEPVRDHNKKFGKGI